MSKVVRALTLTLASQNTLLGIEFFGAVVLARLLSPNEIGLYSVAAVLVLITTGMRNFGVTQYIIKSKELSDDMLRSCLGLIWSTSLALAAILFFSRHVIADFYGRPEIASIVSVMALSFVFAPIILVPYAILVRDFRFGVTYWINTGGVCGRIGGSITLATLGFSYMSLPWGLVIGSVAEALLISLLRPSGVPWKPRFKGMLPILPFGFFTTSAGVLNSLGQGTHDLVLGKTIDMESVGIFSRAFGIVVLFHATITKAIQQVALPYFSKEIRDGSSGVPQTFIRAVQMQTACAWPFFVTFYFVAEELVVILFGDQWLRSVPLAQTLCYYGMIFAIYSLSDQVLIAYNKARLVALKESIIVVIRLAVVIVASQHGLEYVPWALIIVAATELVVGVILLRIGIRLEVFALARALVPSLALAAGVGLTTYFISISVREHEFSVTTSLALHAAVATASWIVMGYLIRHPIHGELSRLLRRA